MKVVINAVSTKSGGAATYLVNLARYFAAHDQGHQYLFCIPSQWMPMFRTFGNNIVPVESNAGLQALWRRFLWDQISLRRFLRSQKADVLISSSDFGMWFPPCKQILMIRNSIFFSDYYLANILPKKSLWFRLIFFIKRGLILASIKSAHFVLTASKNMMEGIRQVTSIQEARAIVNPFGAPLKQFCSHEKKVKGGTFKILHVSEYGDYKNVTTLLKAIKILAEQGVANILLTTTAEPNQFPEVEYKSREEDKSLVSHPLVAPFIRFVGYLPYEKMPDLYADSDLFIFPSLVESFGHPLVEAMASGVPVLASDISICREICGEAALYFHPLDAGDLARKILILWKDEKLRNHLAELGRERAEKYFDWEDHAKRLLEILEKAHV